MNPPTDTHDRIDAAPGSGRETGEVSQLPPPSFPPPGTPSGPPTGEGRTGSGGPNDWDWDRIRDLAEQWFSPLLRPDGWRALGYLFVGMLTGFFFFGVMVGAAALVFGLSFIGVGLLLIGPFFALTGVFARAERAMASWVGVEIEARPLAPAGRFGIKSILDPERWRIVGYLAVNTVLASGLFAIGSFLYTLAFNVIFGGLAGSVFDTFPFNAVAGIVALAICAAALGGAPRVVVWVGMLKAQITSWFLGPDRLAQAERRVSVLADQRQDILDAVATERRRIERNLHDGVQQQLVAIGLDLGMAEQQLDRDPERARELIVNARQKVQGSIGELRQLGRGLHPAILEDRGIDAALSAVVSGAPIPIAVHVDDDLDLDTDVAETVYFCANEALANVLKHSSARAASVHVQRVAANVRVTVHDDGVGGADPTHGTGLAGIRARANAVDGSLAVNSPRGGPTTVVVELPRHVVRSSGSGDPVPAGGRSKEATDVRS
ncbi:MAG: sensor domain-containing protein [Ilumatobacter sp.]|nr:sensor domain-containing protein [Ilumatobacter sp.]